VRKRRLYQWIASIAGAVVFAIALVAVVYKLKTSMSTSITTSEGMPLLTTESEQQGFSLVSNYNSV